MRIVRFYTIMNDRMHVLILALHLALLIEHGLSTAKDCPQGYLIIKNVCIDEDECEDAICGKDAKCINTNGSYYCMCNDGFRPSSGSVNFTADTGVTCTDINECDTGVCGPIAECVNTVGSYNCTCPVGFKTPTGVDWLQKNETCEDTNECAVNATTCDVNAVCKNIPGSYICECNPGFGLQSGKTNYTGNEEQCEDICKIDESICGENGTCHNAGAGHRCECHNGSTNYGHSKERCKDLNCDALKVNRQILPELLDDLSQIHNICLNLNKVQVAEGQNKGDIWLEYLLSAIDKLLSGGRLNNKQVSALLELVENALRMIGPLVQHPETRKSNKHTELELLVHRNKSSPQGPVSLSCSRTQFDCHWETAAGDDSYPGFATVALLSYKGLETSCNHSFSGLKAQDGKSFQINSKVVTAIVSNMNTSLLKDSVNFTFTNLRKSDNRNDTCVYWNSKETDGTWSAEGCSMVHSNATHTMCSCEHLSSFAVLMDLYDLKDTFQLELITWVGLSLSELCLFLCILTFSLIRAIRSTRNTIHLHLCISLFIANLIFLVGISRTENQTGCAVVAGLLHFFYLTAFCWMCLEGVHLFRMVVLVFNTTIRPLYMMLAGYGVPAVIVAITAMSNAQGYGTEKHCWLSQEGGFIWSFFGPVCVIILVNVFFFLITVWKLAQKFTSLNPDLDKLHKIKAFTITAVAQFCVLGTTWIFGCLQFTKNMWVVMSYLFTIFNCVQGTLLFIMHCLLSKQVRDEYSKILDSVCAPQKTYSQFSSNQSSNSKSQNSKSVQNTDESQI